MQVIRKFNNNIVLCVDDNGDELVAFGRGLGFPKVPYELNDLSKVERSFYGIENRYLRIITTINPKSLDISYRAINLCRTELKTDMSPNFIFTLADHIDFCLVRLKKGITIESPLDSNVREMYAKEYQIADGIINDINRVYKVDLPKTEAAGIALNIINSEYEQTPSAPYKDFHSDIEAITRIIERVIGIKINRDNGNYLRYVQHLKALLQAVAGNETRHSANAILFSVVATDYPKERRCAEEISDYIQRAYHYKLNEEELMYLIIHINRLKSREDTDV